MNNPTGIAHVLQPLLGDLDDFERLVAEAETITVRSGEVLFRRGDEADALYVVVNGRLRVALDEGSSVAPEVSRGDVVGEFAFFAPGPRTATVQAIRDSQLVRITQEQFDVWAARQPSVVRGVAANLVRRVQVHRSPPGSRCQVIALVPHRDYAPVAYLAELFPQAMQRQGRAIVLTSEAFESRFSPRVRAQVAPDHPHHHRILEALHDLEQCADVLVLVADPAMTEWTARCIRHADRVVVVARPSDEANPAPLEQHAAGLERPVELVLVHPSETVQPSGTQRWLRPGRFESHHHLRVDDRDQLRSLARRLSGRAIGLVLSGGGARGYAHLGVWRALEEGHVMVDHLGGTSMGALLAAGCAMGMTYEEMMVASEQFANPRRLFDYTFPVTSLFRSRKLNQMLCEALGDVRIEDLWVPFFCVATNLTTAEPVRIRTGLLRDAVRASISIPGVFAPVVRDGHTWVDGGVMDNLPIDTMRELARSERIIAVTVAPTHAKARQYDMVDQVSGWWVLGRRLNPFAKQVRTPSLVATVMRSLEVNSARSSRDQRNRAHLLLEPNVRSVGLLDFHRFRDAADIGYECARDVVSAWAQENAPTVYALTA